MSAIGTKRTRERGGLMSAFEGKADMGDCTAKCLLMLPSRNANTNAYSIITICGFNVFECILSVTTNAFVFMHASNVVESRPQQLMFFL